MHILQAPNRLFMLAAVAGVCLLAGGSGGCALLAPNSCGNCAVDGEDAEDCSTCGIRLFDYFRPHHGKRGARGRSTPVPVPPTPLGRFHPVPIRPVFGPANVTVADAMPNLPVPVPSTMPEQPQDEGPLPPDPDSGSEPDGAAPVDARVRPLRIPGSGRSTLTSGKAVRSRR